MIIEQSGNDNQQQTANQAAEQAGGEPARALQPENPGERPLDKITISMW